MKKILFIVPSLAVGGLEKLQVNLANALSGRGHDVTVMVLDNVYPLKEQLNPAVHFVHKSYKKSIMNKIPYVRNKFYDDGMWETRASDKKLYNYYVGKEKYDVEIAFFRGLAVKIISGSTSETSVKLAWVHSDFSIASGYMNNFKTMNEVFRAYSKFNKVVCVSKQAQKSFIKVIGDTKNLTNIYNFLPVNEIQQLLREKPSVITAKHKLNVVLVGHLLINTKGQLRVIKAISKLQSEGLDVGLVLVGEGQDRSKIEEFISDTNASGYVQMVGEQKNPYPFIADADLLVCASYFEGYNLTVAESLICGTPVLSTRCTGPVEILDNGEYGMIVDNNDEAIYEGIKILATDSKKLKDYKQKAKGRLPFFAEENILNRIEELFDDEGAGSAN